MHCCCSSTTERLGFDAEPFAPHHPDLPLEGQMVGVLGDGHAHGKRRRCSVPGDHRGRRRCRDHRAVARAPVFLPRMPLHVIRRLHRRDALGGLALPHELGERAAAGGTPALMGGELMPYVDDGQGRLRAGPVPGPREAGAWSAAERTPGRRESRRVAA